MSTNNISQNELSQFSVGCREICAARLAFFIPGFAVSTWAPMIPAVKERLAIGTDVLGLLLLSIGVSGFIIMPLAGKLGQKWGCRKLLLITTTLQVFSVMLLSLLPNIISYAIVLAILGAAMGAAEVTMNLNAVIIEKICKRRLMSSMHAFWSIG